MTPLPSEFIRIPLAHRGFHAIADGIPENSLPAFQAAIAAGYGIELDVQASSDGVPMVFHDDDLGRLTDAYGPTGDRTAADLGALNLLGTEAKVPTLTDVLATVGDQTPILIEIKDQGGDPKTGTLALAEQVASEVAAHGGPVAIMSFNPFAVAHGAMRHPDLVWGITTGHGTPLWPDHLELDRAVIATGINPKDWGASFISHGLSHANAHWLPSLRAKGTPILSWTIRTPQQEAQARSFAANITFEGYRPAIPAKAA
ncbi:MAG: glycerophosphodiester phosphodiesterase family protein [Pseudomonadota bacterium]